MMRIADFCLASGCLRPQKIYKHIHKDWHGRRVLFLCPRIKAKVFVDELDTIDSVIKKYKMRGVEFKCRHLRKLTLLSKLSKLETI